MGEKKDVTIALRINKEMHKDLKAAAERWGDMPLSTWIRATLASVLSDPSKVRLADPDPDTWSKQDIEFLRKNPGVLRAIYDDARRRKK